ncbi:MAG TPA: hypothetical protein ENN78_00235, partial [Candidatus Omnitrophica bacterium]|nr:hypothetical protein [Candidatus Omnitrophota bacterium]
MKKRYIEDWIFYWIALCVKGFFSPFPYRIGVAFGAGIIYGLSFFYSRRFSVAYLNLKSTFPSKEPSEIKWLIRRSMFNIGLSLMEFMLSPKLDRKKILGFVDIKGVDDLKEKLAAKSGLIFLTAHYNSWELLPFVGDLLGLQIYVIAREQKYPRLNRLLNDYRSKRGCVVVEKGFSLKTIFRVLKEGKSVGILADQNAGRNGIQVKFFGRFASTNPGFISIARATKSDVRPVFLRRTGIFKHEMILYPNMDLNKPDREILSEYNSILERYIRNNPEQWLWFHKRWKHSVNKNILIISDGKPGHYKQSRMVAEMLKQLLIEKNIREWGMPDEALIKIQEVE